MNVFLSLNGWIKPLKRFGSQLNLICATKEGDLSWMHFLLLYFFPKARHEDPGLPEAIYLSEPKQKVILSLR